MIFTGYESIPHGRHILTTKNHTKIWFSANNIRCAAFIPILYYLVKTSKRQKSALLTLIVWLLYPIVYYLLYYYDKKITIRDSNYAFAIMDIVAKVGFGVLVV